MLAGALRAISLCLLLVAIAGCGKRPGTEVLYPHPDAVAARSVTIYVATTREPAENRVDGFTREREDELSYAEFVISIPPGHVSGEIEWPISRKARPDEDFTVIRHTALSRAAFDSRIGRAARPNGNAAMFVHGFNVSFQEALFRLAQLSTDSNISGVPILFSWPSQARVLDYATDRESATFSRDGLTDVLRQVTSQSAVRSVLLFGHSMGGWLTMEALRQLSLEGDAKALGKLNVILAAPDIDEDVFATQVNAIGPLDPPLMVLVSGDDYALRVSRLLQGNRQRAGQFDITDPEVVEAAEEMNILLLDISSISSSDALRHSRYTAMAAIYYELEDDDDLLGGGFRRAGGRFFTPVPAAEKPSP
ncbi:alpha/beta hydrolase [Martelella soudanensis]|uniref:alpha/beta hydrolase n=1 Tax=unclassified Martelella TaxID=2629616 RepID=UPI0015DE18AC|nr:MULTISPECIES: alpha/beta fold hydrolase [unclassified Martelella]